MEAKQYKVFKFDELSEEAKQKALERLFDINVDHDWWECIYAGAEEVGIKIVGFDCYRGTIGLDFTEDMEDVIKAIINNYDENCLIYATAEGWRHLLEKCHDNIVSAFKYDIGRSYLSKLKEVFEYLQSEEAIIETIKANDYDFLEDGKLDPMSTIKWAP